MAEKIVASTDDDGVRQVAVKSLRHRKNFPEWGYYISFYAYISSRKDTPITS